MPGFYFVIFQVAKKDPKRIKWIQVRAHLPATCQAVWCTLGKTIGTTTQTPMTAKKQTSNRTIMTFLPFFQLAKVLSKERTARERNRRTFTVPTFITDPPITVSFLHIEAEERNRGDGSVEEHTHWTKQIVHNWRRRRTFEKLPQSYRRNGERDWVGVISVLLNTERNRVGSRRLDPLTFLGHYVFPPFFLFPGQNQETG